MLGWPPAAIRSNLLAARLGPYTRSPGTAPGCRADLPCGHRAGVRLPTEYKPRNWQVPGLEVLADFKNAWAGVNLAIEAGPKYLTEEGRTKLRGCVFNIILELFSALALSDRPSIPERRAALKILYVSLAGSSKALHSLDDDSARDLRHAAGNDGDLKIADARRQIVQLRWWARRALRSVSTAQRGRPLRIALRSAISGLHDAWNEAAGKAPTFTPFLKFVTAALEPVIGTVDFKGPCKEILYGEKSGKRRPN